MPKLRFKDSEGREFPKWKEKKLGEIALCLDSQRVPVEKNRREEGKIPYYGANGIQGYVKDWLFDGEYVLLAEDGGHYNEYSSKPIAQFIQGKAWVNNHAHIIEADNRNNTKFLFYSLEHKDIRKYINGSTRGKLTQGDMWKILLCIPSLPEQQKIADFLTTVDRQIDIQFQRVEAMKTRKKGLLQKIFSQEIRFKNDEGKDYPEWDEKKIGEFSQCIAGATPSTKEPRYWENGNIPWMSSGEVNNRIICSTEKKISSLGYENSSTKMLPENTVVIALAGQGKTRGMVAITRIRLCTNQSLCGIVTDSSILSDYLYQFLLTQYEYLRLISSGDGTRGGLNLKIVKDCNIPVPTLPEQQKIADFLTAVDKQIEIEEKRLETMKTIKKGLLQQMFI